MNTTILLWFAIGISAGTLQIWAIWQASRPAAHRVSWQLLRVALIGGILLTAAVEGGLLAAVAGWAAAYFTSAGIFAIRSPL